MSEHVGRDPFARGEYHRFCESNEKRTNWKLHCKWCGDSPKRVYSYVWKADDNNRPQSNNGQWFCNFNCFLQFQG